MTRLIVDQELRVKLKNAKDPVEFCDESGATLGIFTPVPEIGQTAAVNVPFSDEELDRFEAEPGERSLAEILADLQKKL